MPDFNGQPPPFKKKQDGVPASTMPSEVFILCGEMESALKELMIIHIQLDNEYCTSSSTFDVDAMLHQIRAIRQECNQIVDELLEISPKTPRENIAANKTIMVYLAYVGVDRMTCRPRFGAVLDSERPDPGATSSEAKSDRMFSSSISPWRGWPKVKFTPKLR